MTQYSKYNFVYRMQKWIDTAHGQTFLNYGYSWGAAVVILGALFKLTHLPGANIWLFLGMGTEVIVFFLSAFDRPFDKTDDGKEIPVHLEDEEEDEAAFETKRSAGDVALHTESVEGQTEQPHQANIQAQAVGIHAEAMAAMATAQAQFVAQTEAQNAEITDAQTNYITALNNLTTMLNRIGEQSERLTRDSEEMENLNRTLTGITKVYEMQLKGASQQIGTIDAINEQTRKMAQQIEQLNKVYARMIEAMTVNMRMAPPTLDNEPKTD